MATKTTSTQRAKSRAVTKKTAGSAVVATDADRYEKAALAFLRNHPERLFMKIDRDSGDLMAGDHVIDTPARFLVDPLLAERGFHRAVDGMIQDEIWDGWTIVEKPDHPGEGWRPAVRLYLLDPIRRWCMVSRDAGRVYRLPQKAARQDDLGRGGCGSVQERRSPSA